MSSSDYKTRYCPHCREDVTYVVYKRHKGEFYDAHKKEWTMSHVRVHQCNVNELDAADEKICSILASHKGDWSAIVYSTNLAIIPVCFVRVLTLKPANAKKLALY